MINKPDGGNEEHTEIRTYRSLDGLKSYKYVLNKRLGMLSPVCWDVLCFLLFYFPKKNSILLT
jgi:hypothetical protein